VPNPEHPAPTITLTSAGKGGGGSAATPTTAASTATVATTTSSGTNAWEIAALILGGLAVVLSLLAVWLGRPRWGTPDGDD
jgi:uncharacterized protein